MGEGMVSAVAGRPNPNPSEEPSRAVSPTEDPYQSSPRSDPYQVG